MRESSKNKNLRQLKYSDKGIVSHFANNLYLKTIRKALQGIPFQSVLDVGCGEGVSLLQTVSVSSSLLLVGFDLDMERVKIGVRAVKDVHLLVANAHYIPLIDESFDVVMCLETLEHVGEPLVAVAEIARVTKRYALFSVPNEPWWRLGNMARFKYLRSFGNTPGHINHWTTGNFKKMIKSKFTLLRSAQPFLWTFVLAEKNH